MVDISQNVNIEMLEKLPDGTYKRKYPKTRADDGTTFDEHLADYTQFKNTTEPTLTDYLDSKRLSIIKSNKDSEGVFTAVTYKRKTDNTVYATSVLSGGISPQYTTRTITFYDIDGSTALDTKVYMLSYDADGDLVGEV